MNNQAMAFNDDDIGKRLLLLAPTRRDAQVTIQLLEEAGVSCISCRGVSQLTEEIRSGVGAIMVTDVSLRTPDIALLLLELTKQPTWSDIPVVVLARVNEHSPIVGQILNSLTNLTLIDRPSSARAMVSAAKAALRARMRQYQIREQLQEQHRAEQALRLADQRKDEFLATLAHELRNPLAPIRTGLALLAKLSPSEVQFPRVHGMMERQVQQLVKLIDELLDVSRIATGKVELQRELVDMRSVVTLAQESSQPHVDAANHVLQINLPDRPIWVVGDSARLAQCIGNLINNAAKYTNNGGRIEIQLTESEGQARVTVKDNGLGIPKDKIGEVFEMFTQVNRTLDRSQGGLGIGLSLVRSLISLHGGTVVAVSPGPELGSTFILSIPASGANYVEHNQGTAERDEAHVRPLQVLLVDDNQDAVDSLGMLLSAMGHDIRVEYNGRAAIQTATTFRPEVVLCDISMPGMDGHELATLMRRDPRFAGTLLVALTGRGSEEDRRRALAAGFDIQLTKPTTLESIREALARVQ